MALAPAGYQTTAYSRRGFGRSSQPWDGFEYDTLADDLAAVIEQTGTKDATLVGFSMGGGEVARYMSRHGRKWVFNAALISSIVPYMLKTANNPDGTNQSVFEKITQGITADRAAFFCDSFKQCFGVGMLAHPASPAILDWCRAVLSRRVSKRLYRARKRLQRRTFGVN